MNDVVVLPLETSPLVRCYHNMAFPLGMIQGNAKALNKDVTPWAIGKFLNCMFNDNPQSNRYEICMFDWWGEDDQILLKQSIAMYTAICQNLGIDIIDYTKSILREKCYIVGLFNEWHIPEKSAYHKSGYVHDYLIYGYNDSKQVFYSIGYLSNRKYAPFEISYENYLKSLIDSPFDRIESKFWSYNSNYQFQLNTDRILTGFRDYVNSTNTYGVESGRSYGLEANRKLKEYLYNTASSDHPSMDDRYTRALMEHKYMVMQCVKYLCKEKKIIIHESDVQKIENIYQRANTIYMLSLKFNIDHDDELIQSIMDNFDCIEKNEHVVIEKIINSITEANS